MTFYTYTRSRVSRKEKLESFEFGIEGFIGETRLNNNIEIVLMQLHNIVHVFAERDAPCATAAELIMGHSHRQLCFARFEVGRMNMPF